MKADGALSFEDLLRQTIREAVREAVAEAVQDLRKEMSTARVRSEYPPTLTPEHVAEIMGVGLNKAYSLTRRKGFPAIRDGWRILIPRDAFFRWYEEEALRNTGEAASR